MSLTVEMPTQATEAKDPVLVTEADSQGDAQQRKKAQAKNASCFTNRRVSLAPFTAPQHLVMEMNDDVSTLLPADAWVEIALQLLNTTGRNDILDLMCVNKHLLHTLSNDSTLWKSMVFSYYFRLFNNADETIWHQWTVKEWRRLFRSLLACGVTQTPIKFDADTYKPSPFAWYPAWIKGMFEQAMAKLAANPTMVGSYKYGITTISDESVLSIRQALRDGMEEELLLFDGKILYKFGYDVNTTEFWFAHHKAADGTPLHIRIGDRLNADAVAKLSPGLEEAKSILKDEELLISFASLYPHSTSTRLEVKPCLEIAACLTPIVPTALAADSEEHTLITPIVLDSEPSHRPRNIRIYRYVMPRHSLPFLAEASNEVIHLILPLQDPDLVGFNEERIKYYQDQMRAGAFPTIAAFTKDCAKHRFIEKGHKIVQQHIFVSVVLDGHHKLEAAARLQWPVGLLMFADHDRDYGNLYYLNRPVPSWPFNERERNLYLTNEAPFTLLYDNLSAPVPAEEVEARKKAIAKVVSCGDPNTDCVKRVIIPSSLKRWKNCDYNGGMIEFDSQASLIRALIYAQGQTVEGDDPIALQVPTVISSHEWNLMYDLSTPEGVVRDHPPSDGEEEEEAED